MRKITIKDAHAEIKQGLLTVNHYNMLDEDDQAVLLPHVVMEMPFALPSRYAHFNKYAYLLSSDSIQSSAVDLTPVEFESLDAFGQIAFALSVLKANQSSFLFEPLYKDLMRIITYYICLFHVCEIEVVVAGLVPHVHLHTLLVDMVINQVLDITTVTKCLINFFMEEKIAPSDISAIFVALTNLATSHATIIANALIQKEIGLTLVLKIADLPILNILVTKHWRWLKTSYRELQFDFQILKLNLHRHLHSNIYNLNDEMLACRLSLSLTQFGIVYDEHQAAELLETLKQKTVTHPALTLLVLWIVVKYEQFSMDLSLILERLPIEIRSQLYVAMYANSASTVVEIYRDFFQVDLTESPFSMRFLSDMKPVKEICEFLNRFSDNEAQEERMVKLLGQVLDLFHSQRISVPMVDLVEAIRKAIKKVRINTFGAVECLVDTCIKCIEIRFNILSEETILSIYDDLSIFGKVIVTYYVLSLNVDTVLNRPFSDNAIRRLRLPHLVQYMREQTDSAFVNLYPRFLALVTACSCDPYIPHAVDRPFLIDDTLVFFNQFRTCPISWDDARFDITLLFDLPRRIFEDDELFGQYIDSLSILTQAIKFDREQSVIMQYEKEKAMPIDGYLSDADSRTLLSESLAIQLLLDSLLSFPKNIVPIARYIQDRCSHDKRLIHLIHAQSYSSDLIPLLIQHVPAFGFVTEIVHDMLHASPVVQHKLFLMNVAVTITRRRLSLFNNSVVKRSIVPTLKDLSNYIDTLSEQQFNEAYEMKTVVEVTKLWCDVMKVLKDDPEEFVDAVYKLLTVFGRWCTSSNQNVVDLGKKCLQIINDGE